MMKTGTAPTGFRLALVCTALLLITGLAYPTAAGAQERSENDIPEQLWKTYPLDPTKADADAPKSVHPQPSPPAQAETDSGVQTTSESPDAQAQPSGESDSGPSLVAYPLVGALLGLLIGLLIMAAARSGALAITGGYLARGGSVLESPLRAATNAPRYVGRGGAAVVSPLRTLPRLPHRIGHLLLRSLRAVASVVTHVVRSVGAALAAAGQARTVLHERRALLYRLLFYAFIVLGSAGVGLLVTLLLQP
jgi:hypothetical protein